VASKKIAETALKHAPYADVEGSLFLMDELYTSSMVSTRNLSGGRHSNLHGDGQRSRSRISVGCGYRGIVGVSRHTFPPQSSTSHLPFRGT
jgi:hypothetical protein